MKACLERLAHTAELGFSPKCIYDGGAFIGRWAKEVHDIFPQAKIVVIEPNSLLHAEISENTKEFSDLVTLIPKALGAKKGTLTLNVWEDKRHNNPVTAMAASSALPHVQGEPVNRFEVEVTTVDALVSETGLVPDLLKLDLQGYEKFALAGASKALDTAEMSIVEFGLLDAYIERTTPLDLMQVYYNKNFLLYDIVDLLYRPYDGAMTGGDFFFVKKNSKLKAHKDFF